jgi:hypothetical protein
MRLLLIAAIGFSLLHSIASPAQAAWPHDANNGNVALSTAANDQVTPAIVSDGAGGAIVAWSDLRGGSTYDIYAQRVNAAGVPQWTANGVALCTAANNQLNPTITSDGAGGAIVTWFDNRGGSNYDIYAQRVNAAGVPQWTANGVALCTATGDQLYPTIVSDGSAGAIATWEDTRSGNYDIYTQRVNAAGVPQWTANGVALCSAANSQFNPTIASDGAGGAIVTWYDLRGGATYDIYAQRVNAAGAPQWAANGVVLCNAANSQTLPTIVSDGSGGAVVAWQDNRGGSNYDIYAQRVNAAGTTVWLPNGVALCTAAGDQLSPTLASDAAGGAIVSWYDLRSGTDDVYAQRVNGGGAPQWTANGVALSTAAGDQYGQVVAADGAGGAIVSWHDTRNAFFDIYAQRVNAVGTTQWAGNGVAICTAANDQYNPSIVADGTGGAIVVWQDSRNGNFDIYAQRVETFGYLGNPEPVSAGVHDVPNDQGGKVKFSWYPSYIDQLAGPDLAAYDVYRSAPGSVAAAAVRDGARALSSFAEVPVPGERAFVVSPVSSQLYAWEYLATINAAHFLGAYGYVAPTTGDSIGGSNPLSIYMVVGRNAYGSMYWPSAPDSGYSVDNLPPFAPAPFSGTYSAGTAQLHWHANSESDLANYRLYRGTSSSFTPSISNRIAAPTDTAYSDAAGQTYYYKLSAVDVHGNESAFTALLPGGALDVPRSGGPSVWLGPAQPNPALSTAEFRFSLPREERVTLAIYDAEGRRVRDLISTVEPAGEHQLTWDLRDDSGHTEGAGLYFVRLTAEGRTINRRFAAIR